MRILHTSDWHIGRTFHGHSTLPALREVLAALVEQVRENAVDLVIVAGDVFDSSTPPAECYTLLTDTLSALADTGAAVVVTSGNHDSAARLGFQSALLRSGIHVLTDPATVDTPITLTDAHGPVHVYGIPYLEPALLRRTWPGERLRTQHDAIAHAMRLIRADLAARGGRSIVVSHCFAAGVEPTPGLERDIQQGGLDVVPLAEFEGIDYVALGHIHGRQQLAPAVRYAGAPVHYSFGEADKPRGSWLVDLSASGEASVTWLDLPIPRRLLTIRGTLEELCSAADHEHARDAWVRAEYTDATPQRDPLRRLQERFPFCAAVVHAPAHAGERDGRTYAHRVRTARTDGELIDAFLAHVREGEGATDAETALIAEVIEGRTVAEALA
ncbi:exonuclease SbcCD subunit D [Microbacterium schleiferi]|uniref:Nuclease SbcCD subunit D n=1 Tax=Microbacterium schleiferi TaxID=69362 RepID=A0A7S8MVW9_9MICO|nr:exonuclease SbcCD subunit D [Microbacterium schleiferi]QPE04227.1 exonuclease SbcCD subunit D [Microbacterium schleiferi]